MRNLFIISALLALTSCASVPQGKSSADESSAAAKTAPIFKVSESYVQPQPDPLKAYLFTSYAFGLYDPAETPKGDNFATTYGNNVGFGFFGTMLTGKNPFTAGGVVSSSRKTLALSVLSLALSGDSNTHPLQNVLYDYGGKFYYEHPIDMNDDPRQVIGVYLAKKIMEIYPEFKRDQAIEKHHFDISTNNNKSNPSPWFLTSLSFNNEGKKYSFNIYVKDLAATNRNDNLVEIIGFNPYYETHQESGLVFTVTEVKTDNTLKTKMNKNKDLMEQILLKASTIPGFVAFQPRLKYYFYQGNVYTKEDFIKISKKQ